MENILSPADQHRDAASSAIIGTVQGDIHDIGKSLVAAMMRANGIAVHDLGSDMPPQTFLDAYRTKGAPYRFSE